MDQTGRSGYEAWAQLLGISEPWGELSEATQFAWRAASNAFALEMLYEEPQPETLRAPAGYGATPSSDHSGVL